MTLKGRLQSVDPLAQPCTDERQVADQFDFSGPWFTSKVAAAYVCCKSVNSFYMWKKRHFIVSRSNGTVAKADLDRVLKAKKRPRVMAAASLRNLRVAHGRDGRGKPTSSAIPEIGIDDRGRL